MEKILCIAGGIWQKPWIEYLKNKGHYIAVVNPAVTTATELADYHIQTDINDLDTIDRHIEKIKPSFVTSDQSDISTMIVATIAAKWNLPGNKIDTIEKLTNKLEMFRFGRSLGIPMPESAEAASTEEVKAFGLAHGFPIIIKPADSTMSRGFRKIETLVEINDDIFKSTKKFSKTGRVVTQTFISGEMVTLEGVCSGGKHRTIAVSKKDGFFGPGINTGVQYPYWSPLVEKIVATNDLYVENTGMKFGLTHSEFIFENDKFCLIEIGGRGGGAGITDKIVPWVSGINIYEILYQSLMGKVIDVKNIQVLQRPALLRYYTKEQVTNYTEDKNDIIKNLKGVADFNYNFAGKQYVTDKNDIRHTMAIYLRETSEEINELENQIKIIISPIVPS